MFFLWKCMVCGLAFSTRYQVKFSKLATLNAKRQVEHVMDHTFYIIYRDSVSSSLGNRAATLLSL